MHSRRNDHFTVEEGEELPAITYEERSPASVTAWLAGSRGVAVRTRARPRSPATADAAKRAFALHIVHFRVLGSILKAF